MIEKTISDRDVIYSANLSVFISWESIFRQGIKQENIQVPADVLISETHEIIQREVEKIKQQIIVELDLEEFDEDIEMPTSA